MKDISELNLPDDRRYTPEHVWIRKDGDSWVAGISDYAQDQLGEVAYVDLPAEGKSLPAHAEFGGIESVKSVNSLYMPVAGRVIAVNGALEDAPETVNADCYGEGWLVRIAPDDPSEAERLLSADAYRGQL